MTRQVLFNETTGAWEVVNVEDEGYENSITQYLAEFWNEKQARYIDRWVTIPEN